MHPPDFFFFFGLHYFSAEAHAHTIVYFLCNFHFLF